MSRKKKGHRLSSFGSLMGKFGGVKKEAKQPVAQ
jgi:hypothetical protein